MLVFCSGAYNAKKKNKVQATSQDGWCIVAVVIIMFIHPGKQTKKRNREKKMQLPTLKII